jgi:hypothetical protein
LIEGRIKRSVVDGPGSLHLISEIAQGNDARCSRESCLLVRCMAFIPSVIQVSYQWFQASISVTLYLVPTLLF